MPSTGKLLFGAGALLVWAYLRGRQGRRGRKNLPLPPSPPKDPLIGHVRSIPVNDQDIYFYELGQKYGGIVHLDVLGQDLILLNKTKPATDLLEKRGAIFSGRVDSPMADILGISRFLVFMNYGEEWRVHRRIVQRYLTKEKVQAAYNQELWQTAAKSMVINLLKKPDRWQDCFIHYASSFIIEYAYGHRITDEGDYYVELASNFCKEVMPLVRPPNGALVDIFPFAKHLPSWIPGNGLVGLAREANKHVVKFEDYPIRETTDRIAQGKATPSFLVTHLEALQAGTIEKGITLDDIKSLAAVLFVGGADTTSSTLSVFLAAMVLHPEYQAKAQEEIERVIGSDRLPDFSDRASLPLVECIMQETLRWQPAVTFGVPHVSTEEDIYDGMYIPKNSLVIPFLRGMAYDPEVYQNPTKFDPERFLSAPQGRNEPYFEAAFGFGRRVCVGHHLADDVVWIAIATALASLTILRPVDEDGKEYLPKIEFDQGPTCHTHPFPCRIQPRNANMKELISHLTPDLGLM